MASTNNPPGIPSLIPATSLSHPLPDIIDYKVKLLGLLPDGYVYSEGPRRFDLSTACFIKIPSEMTCYEGKIDKKGHPTLIGSGILERKYGLTVHLPSLLENERAAKDRADEVHKHQGKGEVDEDDDDEEEEEDEEGEGEYVVQDKRFRGDVEATILEEEEDESGNESGSEGSEDERARAPPTFICQGCQHNAAQHQKDNLMTKWLKNNFDPRRDTLPDIVCRRTVLTYIMTQKQPFILNAKKISFVSSQDPERMERTVIHVEFDYLPTLDFDPRPPGGERERGKRGASSGASKTPDGLPTSEKNFDSEIYYEKPNLIGYFAGKLSCKVPTMPPENRSIRILLSAIVDGLWRQRKDPDQYEVQDLAEVKSTMDTTVVSDPKKGGNPYFFKQVRMAHAWAQCHLVGINRMMVGVHTLVPGGHEGVPTIDDEPAYALTTRPKRILQELWLYDVDKMPNAVKVSSDEEGFRPWTPTDLKWKLYTALQQIRAVVQHSEVGVTHRFLHYFNEDFLVPMTLEELQLEWKAIHEAYRTLVFKNVHAIQTSPDVIELSMEEVEQEHAEKQVDHILNSFLGLGIPIETVKVVRILGTRKELEVIFPYEALARRVYSTFRLFICRHSRFLPRGYEKLRLDAKRTKRQELERMRRKGSGPGGGGLFYLIQSTGVGQYGGGTTESHHGGAACHHHHHHHHHQRRGTQPSPMPHHHHHHGRHHAHHGKHSVAASNMASSAGSVPSTVFGRLDGGRIGPSSKEQEESWRYTQTMWR